MRCFMDSEGIVADGPISWHNSSMKKLLPLPRAETRIPSAFAGLIPESARRAGMGRKTIRIRDFCGKMKEKESYEKGGSAMRQQENAALQYDTQFLQALSNVSKLPCCLWCEASVWTSVKPNPCGTDGKWRETLERSCAAEHPGIYFEDGIVFWGVFKLWKYYIAIGPAECVSSEETYRRGYAGKHNLPEDFTMPKASFAEMVQCLSLLTCHFWGSPTYGDQVVISGVGAEQTNWHTEGDMVKYQIAQSEYDRSHKSGVIFSDHIVEAVKAGEPDKIKQLMNGVIPDLYENAQVADDERKQMEYMAVSLVTILTRAAIEGGMRMEYAHELGDVYLRRIAAASKGGTFTTLIVRAMLEFAGEVKKAKEECRRSSYVEACKTYVTQNLCKNISVGEIGPAIGISRSYLAHLFKAEEGISLQQYIQREKCRHAERLLKFSDYPIALISEYFGFSSPSYFGVCFRQWYGTTPHAYRMQNSQK